MILTVVLVFAASWPQVGFYPQLSQGDHGRDLYAAQEILRGKAPYKDFWWVYGPVMPYYYACFYKLFGGTVGSFLLGKLVLKTACAAFFYLAASACMAPATAFLFALWFALTQQDFFFTFNHIGGLAMGLWVLAMLFAYIQNSTQRALWLLLPAVFLYGLIKINFGLAALLGTAITVAAADFLRRTPLVPAKKHFYGALLALVPSAWFLVYWLCLKDLPAYAVHQCMPYFGDDQPHHFPPSVTIPYYFSQHWLTFYHHWLGFQNTLPQLLHLHELHSPIQGIMMLFNLLVLPMDVVMHACTAAVLVLAFRRMLTPDAARSLWLSVFCLGAFFILNFHEFVVSGVWYRTYWSLPFLFMFHAIMMATALRPAPAAVRRSVWAVAAFLIFVGHMGSFFSDQQQKIPPRFLGGPHGQVFVGNEPQWTQTVNEVSAYLNLTLKPDELFFALPYDCIYYYLTGRESPTRQLIFFDHIKVPPEQEQTVIRELEGKNVAYVIMSNRIMSSETGLGIFGKTYCPLISQYIAAHYTPIARRGGDWQTEPGWGHNHGVMIFKRKAP